MRFFSKSMIIFFVLFYPISNPLVIGQEVENSYLGELFPDATFICKNQSERCGYSMSGAGDVNGDGFDDFMVAAYHNYLNGWNSGGVYLITGGPNIKWGFNVNIESAATAIFRGSQDYDMVGYCVKGKGDFNGDGYSDLIIGAPGTWDRMPETPGWTYIIFGKKELDWGANCRLAFSADVKIEGEKSLDQFGYAVSFVGDINHDGFDDMICSAPYRNEYKKWDGKVYIILGNSAGWQDNDLVVTKAVASFFFPVENALTGYSVAGVGDVNQDGTPDFVIGVPGANVACLILGRPAVDWGYNFDLNNADYKFWGEFEGDYTGSWISAANDVNNDGHPDFLISAIQSYFNGGRIYLIQGRDHWDSRDISLRTADASFIGEDVETHTGFCTSGLKDYDGDGYDDLLIGARYLNSYNFPHAGKMYLIKGRQSGWQHDTNLEFIQEYFWGTDSITCAGWQVADVGDVNGDRAHDFITSGPFNSTGDHWGGKIYLFFGKNVSYLINGSVKYYSQNQPISNTKLMLYQFYADSSFTNEQGKYSFSTKPGDNYKVTPAKRSDQGTDAYAVSAYDAALVARYVVKIDSLNYYAKIAADVDQDKKVCMYDAAQIARYAVALPSLDSSHVGEFLFDPQSRFYQEIGTSFWNEDYIGLLLGDVDGNWQTTNSVSLKSLSLNFILPKSPVALIHSRISVPLKASKLENAISADIQILYDPEQLEFIKLNTTELTKDFSLIYNTEPLGKLRIAMYTTESVKFDGEIIRLEFNGINKRKTNFTRIQITAMRINNIKLNPEEMRILIEDKKDFYLAVELSNQPNPFNPATNIIYNNVTAGAGKLIIYDILGTVVRTFDLGYLTPGIHEQVWDGADNDGVELTSGIYFVKFICEKDVGISKMIKLK